MERFCQGDEQAFEALFSRHAQAVRAYLARLTGSAVKVRAHRGYEKLRELLKGAWP